MEEMVGVVVPPLAGGLGEEESASSAGEEGFGAVSAGEEGDVESGDDSLGEEEEENFWVKCHRLYEAQDSVRLEPLYEIWLGVEGVGPSPQAMAEFLRLTRE
ncbi:hypothetical protein EMCG_04696 [[Emmonsia] crescens]|uniref:Uncharacterized protein n=1 Tax=[Emmonsia] crescens TaxID=73230 RepID=A0A0G2HR91_9EURO|nr:hypothetical protein EMCG_04696 [Emmonsia crescens UAMH 3008]